MFGPHHTTPTLAPSHQPTTYVHPLLPPNQSKAATSLMRLHRGTRVRYMYNVTFPIYSGYSLNEFETNRSAEYSLQHSHFNFIISKSHSLCLFVEFSRLSFILWILSNIYLETVIKWRNVFLALFDKSNSSSLNLLKDASDGDTASVVVAITKTVFNWGLRLLIDFGRPLIRGLLLQMTIYYYPPPQEIAQKASLFTVHLTPTIIAVTAVLFSLLYIGSLVFDRDVSRMQYILSTACSLLLRLKFPKILKHKRTSVCYATQFPSAGLRFSVDCSLLFHAKLLVFSAIQYGNSCNLLMKSSIEECCCIGIGKAPMVG